MPHSFKMDITHFQYLPQENLGAMQSKLKDVHFSFTDLNDLLYMPPI